MCLCTSAGRRLPLSRRNAIANQAEAVSLIRIGKMIVGKPLN